MESTAGALAQIAECVDAGSELRASTEPEGNPEGWLRSCQERTAGPQLHVVEALDATQIALVPGRPRLPRAAPIGLGHLADAWPIFPRR